MPAATEGRTRKAGKARTTQLRAVEAAVERKIPGVETVLMQRPLSFFGKMDLLERLAEAIESLVDQGVDLKGILDSFNFDEATIDRWKSGDRQIGQDLKALMPAASALFPVILRVTRTVPGLLEDVYLIALGVPPEQWDGLRRYIRRIDDDMGFSIFEVFIEQNQEPLVDFFARWWGQLEKASGQLSSASSTASDSDSSAPSND